jgi:hypothetical protein
MADDVYKKNKDTVYNTDFGIIICLGLFRERTYVIFIVELVFCNNYKSLFYLGILLRYFLRTRFVSRLPVSTHVEHKMTRIRNHGNSFKRRNQNSI